MTAAPKTVLFVDDELLIVMLAGSMLTELGYNAIEAHSAAQALEIIRSDATVDLLISDYSMPHMSGAELVAKARELRPQLPVILATGYAELPKGDASEFSRLGKPFTQDQLGGAIRMRLQGPTI